MIIFMKKREKMKLDFDVVIIGAGVAGMTSALYLKRSGIRCCIIEKYIPEYKKYEREIQGYEY